MNFGESICWQCLNFFFLPYLYFQKHHHHSIIKRTFLFIIPLGMNTIWKKVSLKPFLWELEFTTGQWQVKEKIVESSLSLYWGCNLKWVCGHLIQQWLWVVRDERHYQAICKMLQFGKASITFIPWYVKWQFQSDPACIFPHGVFLVSGES